MGAATNKLTARSRAKRDQIRATAQQLFLERGFANTGTNLIAKEAGVSKETLYRYFPSKEELLADCLRHLIADVPENRLPVAVGEAPLEDRDDLRAALLDLALRFISNLMQPDYVALVRVIITETPRLPQLGSLFRSTVPERAFRSVIDILRMAQDENLVRLPDPETAARMFLGPLLTYVLLDGLFVGEGPPRPPPPERIEAVVDLYLQAIT
ncbi:MAG: TetR/AcrR family transcriptional regulator [Chloroflexota bacterium]|nr:TetR/AcrR family transcriptional regulator [Chloroflexota bacterium]